MEWRYKKKTIYLKNKVIVVCGKLGKVENLLDNKFSFLSTNSIFIPYKSFPFFKNLIKNMEQSVSKGWFYLVEFKGRGFKLFRYNEYVAFDLGYSNLFLFKNLITNISLHSDKQKLILFGPNKKLMLDIIHEIKNFYKVDKYHGKGVFLETDFKKVYKKLI